MSAAVNPVERKKWTCEYQATDEQGNPIGRKTILGPFDTAEELIEAQRKQNESAVRAYFRLKNASPDPAKPRHEFKPKSLTPDEQIQIAAEAKQPSTQQTAFRKQLEAELGAPVEAVRETLQTVPNLDIKAEVEQFVAAHAWKDYYPDPGGQNKAKILGFLQTHNPPLAITANNLEIALENTAGRIASRAVTRQAARTTASAAGALHHPRTIRGHRIARAQDRRGKQVADKSGSEGNGRRSENESEVSSPAQKSRVRAIRQQRRVALAPADANS